MKTKPSLLIRLLFFVLALSPALCALSQIPQGFNYQAVAYTTNGGPVAGTTIQVKMGILSDTITPVVVYEELHSSVRTNVNGVFNVVIGTGVRQSGTAASFSAINWNANPLYLKVQVNYQGTWKSMGNARLWSVPYAMRAGDLSGTVNKLAVRGGTSVNDEALFEVKNKDGQTVFAVYNEGVRVYVSDGKTKGLKGGFAVGGFGTDTKAESTKYLFVDKDSVRIYLDTNPLTKKLKGSFAVGGYDLTKGAVQEYLHVTDDSTRIYVNNNPAKKLKGGFAVGGFDMTKGGIQEYLHVTDDSTRIYVNNNPAKKLKGGFAVGGFDVVKGPVTPFTSLTPENYFIGHEGGLNLTSGQYNSVIGYQSGKYITSGGSNAFLGYQSGYSNTTGSSNLLLGYQAGYSNTTGDYNTFLGYLAGKMNQNGMGNSFIGSYTGQMNEYGDNNTFIGYKAGGSNISGSNNIFIGTESGLSNTIGSWNCFIGYHAGTSNVQGHFNVFMGYEAGNDNSGSQNTFLGYRAGRSNLIGVNNLFVGTDAGWGNKTGSSNTYLGLYAGRESETGELNVFIGTFAGQKNQRTANVFLGFNAGTSSTSGASVALGFNAGQNMSGDMNTCLGYAAGQNANGHFNVVIGSQAGLDLSGVDNVIIGQQAGMRAGRSNIIIGNYAAKSRFAEYNLYIDITDRDSSQAFIWGNFSSQILTFNANVGIGTCTPAYKLQVGRAGDGTEARANAWNLLSDIRYKTDIEHITDPLEKISGINGFYFHWNTGTDKKRQFGLSAQDVEKVLPEVVSTGDDGYKSVDYGKLVPLLVEGMKAQQSQIAFQSTTIESQQKQIDELKALVDKLMQK